MSVSLTGQIQRVTFSNPDNGYTIARLQVQGQEDEHQPGEGGVEPPVLGEGEQLGARVHAQSGQSIRSVVVLSSRG